ncbi:MAG: NADH-quinone oxidoreductase subunit D/NADH-quinone oxidoreductase subunit C/D [Chloroflexi bacterium]|jgi:NADH/F420H2 dehydrogenase subunit C|nr:MAG: NADH-quinone oxidoreductase subunit D/NADH-quinone oxidoreductase subunit C/D [Chloroflexota bacterium]
MLTYLTGESLAQRIEVACPDAVKGWKRSDLWIAPESVLDVSKYLSTAPGMKFDLLNSISAVDYIDHFEIVYHLTSTSENLSIVFKAKVYGRDNPALPSVISIWQGADFQEREIWDLMGVTFQGHPNLKRIMLWDGYEGHPLRRDYLEPPR